MDTNDLNGPAESKVSTDTSAVQSIADSVIPDRSVHLIGKPHPLRTETIECRVEEGQTISQMLTGMQTDFIHVRVNGHMINRSAWGIVRPKAGTVLEILCLPGSNMSKDTAKAVGTAAAIALAVIVTVVTYGAGSAFAAIEGVSVATASALGSAVGAAVGIGGQLLIGALIKPPAPPIKGILKDPEKAFGITGSSNDARQYGVVPCVIGSYRMFPPLTAIPDAYHVGVRGFVRFLFDMGYGNLDISDMKIGNDSILDFPEAETEIGTAPGMYSDDIDELAAGQPVPLGISGTRTSSLAADELSIAIEWPLGFFAVDKENKLRTIGTRFNVEFQLVGSGTWQLLADYEFSNPYKVSRIGGWYITDVAYNGTPLGHREYQFNSTTRDPVFLQINWQPAVKGQYLVRVTRASTNNYNDEDWTLPAGSGLPPPAATGGVQEIIDNINGQPTWTTLKTIRYSLPNTLDTTKVGVKLLATPRLNGVVNQFNAYVQQIIPVWDGFAWGDDFSSNPAYIFRWLLTQCPANARIVSTSRIDDDTIKAWGAVCADEGYVFNAVIEDGTTMFQLLSDVAAAGRATLTVRDGKYSVVQDVQQTVPVQHFTPRNSSGFSGSRTFGDTIHALKCRFNNPAAYYQSDEFVVYYDGYALVAGGSDLAATRFETFDMRGVTSADAIWKLARYHMAVARLRQTEYTWKADIEHLVCQRGDLVKVTHDLVRWGIGSGRVSEKEADGTVWGLPSANMPAPTNLSYNLSGTGTAVTVGTRFKTDLPSVLKSVTLIKPGAVSTKICVWTDAGVLLGTATYTPYGSAGDTNYVNFDRGLQLVAGNYVITYYVTNGLVSYTPGYHTGHTYQNNPITVPADGDDGKTTGRAIYADAFPTNGLGSFGGTGFSIQPILRSAAGAGDAYALSMDETIQLSDKTALAASTAW
jgi:Domain of unknown function (DUF4082)/Putative phage tail protein